MQKVAASALDWHLQGQGLGGTVLGGSGEDFSRAQHTQSPRTAPERCSPLASKPQLTEECTQENYKAHSQVSCTHNPYAKLGLT